MIPHDPDPPPLPPDLGALADDLRALRPTRLDPARRDAILVAAGRASARRPAARSRFWPALAASLGLVALGEGVLLAHRPPPLVVERVVVVRQPAPVPAAAPAPTLAPIPVARGGSPPLSAPPSVPIAPITPIVFGSALAGRWDRAERLLVGPTVEFAPRLPGPSGVELRRVLFRQALFPSGDPS